MIPYEDKKIRRFSVLGRKERRRLGFVDSGGQSSRAILQAKIFLKRLATIFDFRQISLL